jgi:hypothetical protein
MTHKNNKRLHHKGLEGPHTCPAIRANLLHGRNGPDFFTGQEEGNDFVLKTGRQDGARSLGCVNKLLQLGVRHVNETFTDDLEVETDVV